MKARKSQRGKSAQPPLVILIALSALVLLSVIGLDYIGWKNGVKSYLFSALAGKKKVALSEESLEDTVLKSLASYKISSDSIQQYRDNKDILHLMVDFPSQKYRELEFYLEKEFKKTNTLILEKEEQQGEEKNYYLWRVEGKRKKRMIILFSCKKEELIGEDLFGKKDKNKVAIIIDDMGNSLEAIKDICSIKKPLTVSILPFSPLAQETAQIAHRNGLEVMLHLPLESVNGNEENHIEGIIHSRMSKEEIIKTVKTNLDQVPYIKGVNNHMGSKITANEIFMSIILECLKTRDLFFVDSRTTTRSVAYKIAQKLKIPSANRHVFLDGEINEDYIKKKMIELFRKAQKNGIAVGICHPTKMTLKVLKENFHLVEKFNLEPVFVSQIIQ
ncbi:MAG: divergent polysaccharide deacetylase family protein [Candidatus Aminicenantes bacterium]|nr:divergent polysaccharide deacetylase family protein [Candidatus Aminicenantes bacterium]